VVDDTDPEVESDLRRRAAWLLVMLAIAAVLLIVVISAVVGTDKSGSNNSGPGSLDNQATGSSSNSSSAPHTKAHHTQHSQPPPGQSDSSTGDTTSTSSAPVGQTTCPGSQTCVLAGDVGNAIPAINAFRTQHGLPEVPGSVSTQAQNCALHNGSGCSGSWAETLLSKPDGQEAVQKIEQFAHFEDPQMKTVEVGWAYDPGSKTYYFAIVRND
jgi:hypothetical protein